jgi:hypothetical protein
VKVRLSEVKMLEMKTGARRDVEQGSSALRTQKGRAAYVKILILT